MRLEVAVASLMLALVGCGGDELQRAGDQGSGPAVDELGEHQGRPCPAELVDPDDDHGFGTDTPAEASPSLAEQDAAWTCLYEAHPDPDKPLDNGTYLRWELAGEPTEMDDDELAEFQAAVEGLAPSDPNRACTADLGPRVLFVASHDGDLTGVVVERYGCGDVRLTDDPYANPPGVATQPGTVSGVLSSPALRELAGHATAS